MNVRIEQYQQKIVDKLIAEMQNNPKWAKKWTEIPFMAYNGFGKNIYRGINQAYLAMHLIATKSADPRYYTFKQIKDLNLKLKKGSKAVEISFWKYIDKETTNKDGEELIKKIPFLRLSNVFNAKDIKGLKPYEKSKGFAALKDNRDLTTKLQEVIKNSSIEISHGGNRAYYSLSSNSIMMPPPERFSSQEAYASTLLHELAHSTGHKDKQNRITLNVQGKDNYAKEELRAELSSVFMCQRLGIKYTLENDHTHIKNSAAYLKSWIKVLKNDKSELFKAATDASKITAFLVYGKSFDKTKILTKPSKSTKLDKLHARRIKETNYMSI